MCLRTGGATTREPNCWRLDLGRLSRLQKTAVEALAHRIELSNFYSMYGVGRTLTGVVDAFVFALQKGLPESCGLSLLKFIFQYFGGPIWPDE